MSITEIVAVLALLVATASAAWCSGRSGAPTKLKAAEFVNSIEDKLIEQYKVYRFLLAKDAGPSGAAEAPAVDPLELLAYVGFFERILPILENRAVPMRYIDRIFGYRFFLMAHHPYVQENILLNRSYADAFTSVFQLHSQWKRFRTRRRIPIPFIDNDLEHAAPDFYRAQLVSLRKTH